MWARGAHADAVGAALAGGGLVLVDASPTALEAGVEDVLVRALTAARAPAGGLVLAGDGGELAGAFRGLAAVVRAQARTCLLLGRGGRVPAEVVARRPLPAPGPGPGAGFVVVDGRWTGVRVAWPGERPTTVGA